jgi:hypothetical protein
MAQQIAPPAKGMQPRDYYNQLISQGMRPYDAYRQVEANFGPPKSPQQQAEDMASADQKAGLAQTGGTIGGLLLGQEALAGFPTVSGWFGGGAGAGAVEMPTALGGETALGAAPVAEGTTLSSIGSVGLPAAAIIAGLSETWEGGMKDIIRGRGNRQDWTNMGVNAIGGVGPNLVLRWMGKPSLGRMMTSGKSDAQLLRDDFRGKLQETGVADKDYKITLANGDKYDIGKDGKAKLTNIDGKTTRRTWDVDWDNPLAKYAVDKLDPRVRSIYTEEAAKAGIPVEQYTGMLVNAATYNAKTEKDVEANINAMLGKSGLDKGPGATINKKPEAPIAVRPPAPLPPGAKPGPIETPKQKQSMGDILRFNINK